MLGRGVSNRFANTAEEQRGFLMAEDSLLDEYEKEYQETSASVSRQISALRELKGAKELTSAIQDIKDELSALKQCVRDMSLEVRTNGGNESSKWNERIERYTEDLRTLQRDFERSTESAQRSTLYSHSGDAVIGGGGSGVGMSEEQSRLMMSARTESDNTAMLQSAAQELHETEERAIAIGDELHSQGETIRRIKSNLGEGSTVLGRIGRGLSRISRRQALMSVMWVCIIVILLTVISLIIWVSVKNKKK